MRQHRQPWSWLQCSTQWLHCSLIWPLSGALVNFTAQNTISGFVKWNFSKNFHVFLKNKTAFFIHFSWLHKAEWAGGETFVVKFSNTHNVRRVWSVWLGDAESSCWIESSTSGHGSLATGTIQVHAGQVVHIKLFRVHYSPRQALCLTQEIEWNTFDSLSSKKHAGVKV